MGKERIHGWMADKLTRVARERELRSGCSPADALNLMCGEAITTIRGEMAAFPELARMLPSTLARNINNGALSALSGFELAVVVIADADAQDAAQCAGPDDVRGFTALKIRALADLLAAEEGAIGVHQSAA